MSVRQKRIFFMLVWGAAIAAFVYLCILAPLAVGAQADATPLPDCTPEGEDLWCILPDPVALTSTPTLTVVAPTPFEPTSTPTMQPTATSTRRPTFTPTPIVISPLPRHTKWLPMAVNP